MQAFFADYGALIAPITAIISTFISVLVAQFYKDHPVAKVLLVVAAGVFGAASVTAIIIGQRQIVAAKVSDQLRHKEIREAIGKFITEGLAISSACSDNNSPPRWQEINSWITRINDYLRTRLDESYVARLKSPSGIPINVECRGADEAHNLIFRIVYVTTFRLEQFSSESSSWP